MRISKKKKTLDTWEEKTKRVEAQKKHKKKQFLLLTYKQKNTRGFEIICNGD
jgi:hypothetical protein